MTWTPDHRTLHRPGDECEACRPPEARGGEPPRPDARAVPEPVRRDLVIQPGTNRK